MYDHILYPTDGSDGAAAALRNARDLAELCGATVHVLHSIGPRPAAMGLAGDPQSDSTQGMVGNPKGESAGMVGQRQDTQELREEVESAATDLVETVAEEFDPVPTETAVRRGRPHEAILDYAAENDVDAIVIGTHGRTGLDRYLIGSTTEKVVRLSDVPVVTVRGDDA